MSDARHSGQDIGHACTVEPTADPLWLMVEQDFTPAREHEFESLFAVSNGYLGNRGSLPIGTPLSTPAVFLAGVFDTKPPSFLPELVVVPGWTLLSERIGAATVTPGAPSLREHRRVLDMRQGIFWRIFRLCDEAGHVTRVRFLRIASLAERHVLLQSSLLTPENYSGPVAIRSGFVLTDPAARERFSDGATLHHTAHGPVQLLIGKTQSGIRIAVAAAAHFTVEGRALPEVSLRRTTGPFDDLMEMEVEAGKTYRNDWFEVCYTSRDLASPAGAAVAHLERLLQTGVPGAVQRHVAVWEARWRAADIVIENDEDAQRAIRFACYHLISAVNAEDEHVSIGAKALTGPAYKGHVFWDTEIFLLPFYTLTYPAAARALLMYRFRTLGAARRKAARQGYAGALYAWESADSGEDVTPPYVIMPTGEVAPVLTGAQEHHISADIAYAVWQYWQATGDDSFLREAGAEMLVETARFWASRGRIEIDGLYHIRKVIGPDEYHEGVDDNAYTNWMARANLEYAVEALRLLQARWPERFGQLEQDLHIAPDEASQWQHLAAKMYTGLQTRSGLIEQFAGYFGLEDIDLAQYAPRSLPIDVVLGRERTQGAKIIKQADVVMLLHLLWQQVPAALRAPNFRYYEPRTEHGSSLSPSMHALLAARLGDTEMALRYFRQAREIDLADNMGNAAGGVHIASLGGLWQTIVFGFAGLGLSEQGLSFSPHCPACWPSVRFALQWHGRRLEVRMTPDCLELEVRQGRALPVAVNSPEFVPLEAGHPRRWDRLAEGWKEYRHD